MFNPSSLLLQFFGWNDLPQTMVARRLTRDQRCVSPQEACLCLQCFQTQAE